MKMTAPRLRFALVVASAAQILCSAPAIAQSPSTPAEPPITPMVKPPAAAPGAASATNPDNMPVRKPQQPTNDRMIRSAPASAAKAK